ncbi:hypothetical protein OAD66_08460 [Bacteroidia bacterium]|nr:hypothetical protein [Bacteroidia bacterium]MDB4107233.1 hypothetical protein [Bacteroidia bacterium]MDB9883148.1 hypothetical protein [Bacteroidia bacterium]
MVSTGKFTLAFLDDDIFVADAQATTWTKSTVYESMDANKKNVLRYSDFTEDGKPINSQGQYSTPIKLIVK